MNGIADTMRKGIINPALYEADPEELMLGMLVALVGGALWLVLATFFSLPVSATQSMGTHHFAQELLVLAPTHLTSSLHAVGALLGFIFVAQGSAVPGRLPYDCPQQTRLYSVL